jgi:hypothetical protein
MLLLKLLVYLIASSASSLTGRVAGGRGGGRWARGAAGDEPRPQARAAGAAGEARAADTGGGSCSRHSGHKADAVLGWQLLTAQWPQGRRSVGLAAAHGTEAACSLVVPHRCPQGDIGEAVRALKTYLAQRDAQQAAAEGGSWAPSTSWTPPADDAPLAFGSDGRLSPPGTLHRCVQERSTPAARRVCKRRTRACARLPNFVRLSFPQHQRRARPLGRLHRFTDLPLRATHPGCADKATEQQEEGAKSAGQPTATLSLEICLLWGPTHQLHEGDAPKPLRTAPQPGRYLRPCQAWPTASPTSSTT